METLCASRACPNHVTLVHFCHLLSCVTLNLFPPQPWHSLKCPNSSTPENLLLSALVMCASDLSPQVSFRPAASTAHPTEGVLAGEGYPAGHYWPDLHWPSHGREEGNSEMLGNDKDQQGTICTLQVSICHGQPGGIIARAHSGVRDVTEEASGGLQCHSSGPHPLFSFLYGCP